MHRLAFAVAAGALLAGCGGTNRTANPQATARGQHIKSLAATEVDALPSGTLYGVVHRISQPPGSAFPVRRHDAGFNYVDDGVQVLHLLSRPANAIHAGECIFQPSLSHTHTNPSTKPNLWYFVAIWPTADRRLTPPSPLIKLVYATHDIDPRALPQGHTFETLKLATLDPHGRSAAHRYGGVEMLYVLQGTIHLDIAGAGAPVTLSAGQGRYIPPGRDEQELNAGAGAARYLVLIVTPAGAPFETTLRKPV